MHIEALYNTLTQLRSSIEASIPVDDVGDGAAAAAAAAPKMSIDEIIQELLKVCENIRQREDITEILKYPKQKHKALEEDAAPIIQLVVSNLLALYEKCDQEKQLVPNEIKEQLIFFTTESIQVETGALCLLAPLLISGTSLNKISDISTSLVLPLMRFLGSDQIRLLQTKQNLSAKVINALKIAARNISEQNSGIFRNFGDSSSSSDSDSDDEQIINAQPK